MAVYKCGLNQPNNTQATYNSHAVLGLNIIFQDMSEAEKRRSKEHQEINSEVAI